MAKRRKHDPAVDVPKLYGALTEGLVRYMDKTEWPVPQRSVPVGQVEPIRAKKGGNVGGPLGVPSNIKRAARMLQELGVAASDPELLCMLIDGKTAAEYVAKRIIDGNCYVPPIDEVLTCFLRCAADGEFFRLFGLDEGQLFLGPDDYQPVFEELHHAGYLGWAHRQWRWTRRAATAMQLADFWPARDWVSDHEIWSGTIDDELREMLVAMPEDVRNYAREFYFYYRFWLNVSHRWKKGAWGPAPRPGEHVVLIGGEVRARRLQELIKLADQKW
jgi:hypothetical protein